MNEENDDFETDDDEEFEVYEVDEETRDIIQVACNLIANLAQVQMDDTARMNLMTIADTLAERFAIDTLEIEEQIHQSEDGPEIIYKPKGGIFDEDEENNES